MRSVIVAAFVAFTLSLFGTPLAIRYFTRLKVGQPVRDDGHVPEHSGKKGTPTMGGVVFILATVVAYIAGHLVLLPLPNRPHGPTVTGVVLLGVFVGAGLLGFLDDFMKVRQRKSLGLNRRGKLIGQLLVGVVFGTIALYFPATYQLADGTVAELTVASENLSFTRDIDLLTLTKVGAVILFAIVVIATTNGVNLTDGLDGLATGSSVMVLGSYLVIAFWQYRHWCADPAGLPGGFCYPVRDPLDIALVAGSAAAACFGFLWWNAAPARIFMGDTGALGLGGLIAALAMATQTILLLLILGGLFVMITMSVILQMISYRTTGRRLFRMSPLQHHFEMVGWHEVTIVIRFWIIAALAVAIGLAFFFADFLAQIGR